MTLPAALEGDTAILVVSCDKYWDLWRPFFNGFRKYWPDCPYKRYLGTGIRKFEDTGVTTIAVGPDVSYTDNLRAMLRHVSESWVILWVEDRMLSAPVDTAMVGAVTAEARRLNYGYVKLLSEAPYAYGVDPGCVIGPIPAGMPYRTSFTIGLWRKSVLLELLKGSESAWELERNGSIRSGEIRAAFGTLSKKFARKPLISHAHVIIKGCLTPEGRVYLESEGMLGDVSARRSERFLSIAYRRIYHAFFAIVRPVQYRVRLSRSRISLN